MPSIKLPSDLKGSPDATVVRWLVEPGDTVTAGQTLVELAGTRGGFSLTSPADGTLSQIAAAPGVTLKAGEELGTMDISGAAAPKTPVEAKTKEQPMSEPKGDVTPILMPKVGNSMEEGTILGWNVAEGDVVEVGQVIYEVETDKAAVEVEADHAGRLARIVAAEGDTVEILKPVAYIAENDDDVDLYIAAHAEAEPAKPEPKPAAPVAEKPKPAPAASKPAPTPATAPAPQPVAADASGRIKASPAARRIAAERGVNLASVAGGSGPNGRILSTDVLSAPIAGAAAPSYPPIAVGAPGDVTSEVMTSMRKAIGQALQNSKQTVPHFYVEMTFDADAMMAFYRQEKAQYKCTVNDVMVFAVGRTLAEFPEMRSRVVGDAVETWPDANIGVAMGSDQGLIVPVVLGVDKMTSLRQVAGATAEVVAAGKEGKMLNVGKGVFTISNLGMFGVPRFSAIINPPEAGILAVGAVREEVIVKNGMMRPGRVCTVTLSCDHRVADGLVAAKFLARLKQALETPTLLL